MQRSIQTFFFIISLLSAHSLTYAFDSANDSTVDKADRFEFEDFHKDKAVNLWGKEKEQDKKDSDKKTETTKVEKGQESKVRSAYKLSADPALANLPTLFDAIQDLHKQLNSYCPNGWEKEAEWHQPEQNYFYIYYRASCL